MADSRPVLGILGGMGPLATVDFMQKVIDLTPAKSDQDHFPMLVASVPQVPDRTAAILRGGESPLPVMLGGLRTLNTAGVSCIAIPCNSAHHWYDDMARESKAPILHIADAACAALTAGGIAGRTVGFLGTSGVLKAGIYQKRLAERGFDCLVPDEADQENQVMGGIYHVKAGDLDAARGLLTAAADGLRARGAAAVILGCTEIPIVIDEGEDVVDATRALAQASIAFLSAYQAAA